MNVYDQLNGESYDDPDAWDTVEALRQDATVPGAMFTAAQVLTLLAMVDSLADDLASSDAGLRVTSRECDRLNAELAEMQLQYSQMKDERDAARRMAA